MTHDLLGDTLDIHAGGEDLVFPHHTNEIAQSETLTGKQFVRYWVHIRHLMINGKKMSKSLGNYIGFDEVLAKYSPDAFRYFYLGTQYRRPLDYTDDAMKSAEGSVKRLENTLDLLDAAQKTPDDNLDLGPRERRLLEEVERYRTAFEAAMDDDLDSHTAIDSLHAMSGVINEYLTATPNKGVTLRAQFIYRSLLDTLGLFERRGGGVDKLTEDLIKTLIDLRNQYRKEKNYRSADEIRSRLSTLGVTLADSAEGTTWKMEKR
jgi:cysteinyl-tRNA synthetase